MSRVQLPQCRPGLFGPSPAGLLTFHLSPPAAWTIAARYVLESYGWEYRAGNRLKPRCSVLHRTGLQIELSLVLPTVYKGTGKVPDNSLR